MKKKKPLKVIAGTPDKPLIIGDIEIPCYVLEDETRVLSQRGLQSSIAFGTGGGQRTGARRIVESMEVLGRKGLDIKDLIARLTSPIEFQPLRGGRTAYGYPATLLPQICEVYLKARDVGALQSSQQHIAVQADILIRGFALVGIIALIDEVTGFQSRRDKQTLRAILDEYLREKFATWAKRFPDEFYIQIFRLKGWQWRGMKVNRPRVIGRYTTDIVYQRLAPGIVDELEKRNPTNRAGNRRVRHHQYFTEDIGHAALAQHLHTVISLMKASTNWEMFKRLLERALPKQGETIRFTLNDSNSDQSKRK